MSKPAATPEAIHAVWLTMTFAQMRDHFGLRSKKMSQAIQAAGGAKIRNGIRRANAREARMAEYKRLAPEMNRFEAAEHFKVSLSAIDTWGLVTGVRCVTMDRYRRNEPVRPASRFSMEWSGGMDKALWTRVMGAW